MDSVALNQNGDYTSEIPLEQLLPPESADACDDIFGEPEIFPRIGDEYQVEIPPLTGKSDYTFLRNNTVQIENRADICDFFIGLPIPLIWINQEAGNMKRESELLGHSKCTSIPEIIERTEIGNKNDDLEVKIEAKVESGSGVAKGVPGKYAGPGYFLVPGTVFDCWSDNEKASFLLGLYIFEKNFVLLRRFMESKKMGDILSFYYGKFYGSHGYRRWSECRKMRSRKCAYGPKIFSGLRQQELLSRLLPHVSEEHKSVLLEVAKTFAEGKMTLEEYVFSLKSVVGINILVEAIGIGKGKQDLTCMALEPSRSNNLLSMRSEIPIGKACSSLTPSEIIKFLTGDYRLSKARSNDLFWEAVWPRLLARGWHSEQPKNQNFAASSKHSLVFLMPGVKKFSRRRLVKGDHYFDSVTDVLSKVASDPGLLELDIEEDGENKKQQEYEWADGAKLEKDPTSAQRRHCYLQPRTPKKDVDVMKFTVVDTSLVDGKPYKLRELKCLPFEISNKLSSGSHCEDSDDNNLGTTDESDSIDTVMLDQVETDNTKPKKNLANGELFSSKKDFVIASSQKTKATSDKEVCEVGQDAVNVITHNLKSGKKFSKDQKSGKVEEHRFSKILKQENVDNIAPVTKKRRRLTACSRPEKSNIVISLAAPRMEPVIPSCCSSIPISTENNNLQVGSSQDKLSSTSSSKSSPIESIECVPIHDCHASAENIHEDFQTRTLIDLNVPQIPPDFENDIFTTELAEEKSDDTSKKGDTLSELPTAAGVTSFEQEQEPNFTRRHSTRNRPPTTRALEALASGFLTVSRRRKSKESSSRENLISKNLRRVRPKVEATESSTSTVISKIEQGENSVCNGEISNAFSEFPALPEGKETPMLNP